MLLKKVVHVGELGDVFGIHSDVLAGLGDMAVVRASNVEFDNKEQFWRVLIRVGSMSGRYLPEQFKTRQEALNAEVEFLSSDLKNCKI